MKEKGTGGKISRDERKEETECRWTDGGEEQKAGAEKWHGTGPEMRE